MKKLNIKILEYLVDKTGKAEKTIRKNISFIRREFPNCTINAAAQIYAIKNRLSVMQKLDQEDKKSLPDIQIQKAPVIKAKAPIKSHKIPGFIAYETTDYFISGHIAEVNKAYDKGCFTSAYMLIRKVIENLIIDILRAKYPESGGIANKELYYNVSQHRFLDFSVILDNLYKKRNDFGIDGKKIIERLNQLCKELKNDANYKVHSWFHLVETKNEFDNINIHQIMELIVKLEKSVGIHK